MIAARICLVFGGHDVVGRYFQDHPNGHVARIEGEGQGMARLQQLYGLLRREWEAARGC